MKKIHLLLPLLLFSILTNAQPWRRTMKALNSPIIHNISYDYHSQFGGVAMHYKPGGNYHPTIISYNNRGDSMFKQEISFDSLSGSPFPYVYSAKAFVDNLGNRHVIGLIWVTTNYWSIQGFHLKYDSLGNLIMNYYTGDAPWPTTGYDMLISKTNFTYSFFCEDSLVSNTPNFPMGFTTVHLLKQEIYRRTLSGNLAWKMRWTQPDITDNTNSNALGSFSCLLETADGNINFIRFDSSMTSGPILYKINPAGVIQYSLPINPIINQPGYDSYVTRGFATSDSCINLYGYRALIANPAIQNCFLIKLNQFGQFVDSLNLGTMYIEDAKETSNSKIWISYFNMIGNSYSRGILILNKNYTTHSIHPEQSLERYNNLLVPNSIGGCHLGLYINNPAYTGDHTFEMCNYDSLFNTYPNKLVGNIYQDNNKNCTSDPSDANLAWKSVSCTDGQNNSYYSYSNSSGQYSVRVPNGTYTLSHNPGAYKSTMCPNTNLAYTFNNANSLVTQNYFDTIIPNMNDLKISLFGDPFWIGNASYITAYYQNVGTKTVNATVKIVKDPAFTFSTSLPAANSLSGDSLFYNFTNIAPDSSGFISVNLVPSPNLISGTQLIFKTFVSNNFIDADPTNNLDSLTSMYYGSLKMASSSSVSSSNNINVNKPRYIYGNEDLIYKIRFQNTTGNLVKDVLIIDTLSPYLDYSTFKIIGASQAYNFSIHSGGKLMVRFLNHNLQDSAANESQSKGYLVYTIRPRSDWSFTKKIHNQACIYFDYLNIVTTNQTINQKLDAVGIMENSNGRPYHFAVFPNPVKDEVIINCRNIVLTGDIKIYNIAGELILSKIPEEKTGLIALNLSTLANGLYILKTNSSIGPLTKKIIVQK